jgi:GntR family transcriptional repressor for pyruvate dehydrogenase complex
VPDQLLDDTWARTPTTPRTSVDEVSSELKNMVHTGELGPGDRLPPERQLCEMLQVSRSTLREGLRALRSEGYLEVRRGSSGGHFISRLDEPYARWLDSMRERPAQLQEVIEVRMAVECEVARLAAERQDRSRLPRLQVSFDRDPSGMSPRDFRDADAQFHLLLADAAGNARLKALVTQARGELFTPANSALLDNQTRARSTAEHQAILEAVRAGDVDRASHSMREHLQSTFDDVRRAMSVSKLPPQPEPAQARAPLFSG